MDMYQKRKMRQEKNVNKQAESTNGNMNINCVDLICGNSFEDIELLSSL